MLTHPELELATYKTKLPELLEHEGQFALLHGEEVVDFFDTYGDALKAGYKRFQLDPFLIKQVARVEQPLFFARDFLCLQ
jgi:hypothetical protein